MDEAKKKKKNFTDGSKSNTPNKVMPGSQGGIRLTTWTKE